MAKSKSSRYEIPSNPREIQLDNIGPHEKLRLCATPGKITVLTGPNGVGKTQVLDAVEAAQKGSNRLQSRDGTHGGTARFGGVKISVGRGGANRRSGELVVHSLEDRLSIADFVDPGLKDPNAADEARIRALLMLLGVEANVEKFFELTDGDRDRFMAIATPSAVEETDIIKMATKVKRDFDAAARKVEADLENLQRERDAKIEANEGIDLEAPHDADELESARDAARDEWQRLKNEREAGQKARNEATIAQVKIKEAVEEYSGPSIEDAEQEVQDANKAYRESCDRVEELKRQLADAEVASREKKTELRAAEQQLASAQAHERAIAGWREAINAGAPKYPKQETVDEAEKKYLAAKEAAENGVRIRDAIKRKKEIDRLTDRVTKLDQEAETLRSAGRNTQVVLSKLVDEAGAPLRVDEEFRLIARHEERGECYFSELSMGERWKLGIDIVLWRADKEGLLVIPQEAWESLDGENRELIATAIDGSGLSILTAEAQQIVECDECGEENSLGADTCTACGSELPAAGLVAHAYGE